MALPQNHRWIAVGNLSIRKNARAKGGAPDFLLEDVVEALEARILDKNTARLFGKETRMMWCNNIEVDPDHVVLLIQVGDKNVTGSAFVNFETMVSRDVDKEDDEGGHYSAHVLIHSHADEFGRYTILVEKVPGVYLASVKAYLTWLFSEKKYQKTGNPLTGAERRFFKPVCEIDGHQARTIRDALKTGTLQDIEFVAHNEIFPDGLDEEPLVKEEIHETRWEIKRRVAGEQAQNLFTRVRDRFAEFRGSKDNAQLFVRIKADNGQIRRTEVQERDGEILEQVFVQNEIVTDFDPVLEANHKEIRRDMKEKMIGVLKVLEG